MPFTMLADVLFLALLPVRPPDRMVGVSASESDMQSASFGLDLPRFVAEAALVPLRFLDFWVLFLPTFPS